MTVRELREKFLRFFESKEHHVFPAGSLVPIDVTGRLDESLLFNGAGMIQFKPYFRGVAKPAHPRLITCQPCVRTNDIDEVGDDTHLSFFEMLGNFSFGDYFKEDAIRFSWEFLTSPDWLGLDPARLSLTVFEDDDEAVRVWQECGARHIIRLGEDTNYWPAGAFSAGPPGPCGPNSEMFYWVSSEMPPTQPQTAEQWLADDAAGNWVEIWNDVFIQFEWQGEAEGKGWRKTGMPELPFRSIDTGMGLERTALVLGGYQTVYDTDVFQPILKAVLGASRPQVPEAILASEPEPVLEASRPQVSAETWGQDSPNTIRAARIIADHLRTASFCIADGILPANNGRGYVLRRLIRRAVLQGQRKLGIQEPFLYRAFDGLVEAMGDHYVVLHERRDVIVETLKNEEELFRRTLLAGTQLLEDHLAAMGSDPRMERVIGGAFAFQLYDTYGFPLEVTQELAAEAGVSVDVEGYEIALEEAQRRSRAGQDRGTVYGAVIGVSLIIEEVDDDGNPTPTRFDGYEFAETESRIVAAIPEIGDDGKANGLVVLALNRTPFYAESGGQVSDSGSLEGENMRGEITDVIRQDGLFVHGFQPTQLPVSITGLDPELAKEKLSEALFKKPVRAVIDRPRRARIQRNHTATHLLHAALRQTLGPHVTQAGSYVGPDRLRFDFTHRKALSPQEREVVERIVNEQALANLPVVTYVDIPVAEAKARGAMALFGEKYGDRVRMVEIGEFSRELCGGTHVRSTGEIGLFKIIGEGSTAGGVRRIEALTGEGAYEWVQEETRRLHEAADLLKTSPAGLLDAIHKTADALREERRRRERAERASLEGGERADETHEFEGVRLRLRNFGEVDPKIAAHSLDNQVAQDPTLVSVAAVTQNGKVVFSVKVGPEAVAKGAHAGNLIREVAKVAGGGGGGRPDFATAGGKDPGKVDAALAMAVEVLRAQLGTG